MTILRFRMVAMCSRSGERGFENSESSSLGGGFQCKSFKNLD